MTLTRTERELGAHQITGATAVCACHAARAWPMTSATAMSLLRVHGISGFGLVWGIETFALRVFTPTHCGHATACSNAHQATQGEFVDSFVAIDFETAANRRASACAIGLAAFTDGSLEASIRIDINPGIPDEDWSPFARAVHGMQPADVRDEPTFEQAAGRAIVESVGSGRILVAHNAAFDTSVLRAEFMRYEIPLPPMSYVCSMKVARAAWPKVPSCSLPVLAEMLGIPLKHHDPESDAVASGLVLMRAFDVLGGSTFEECLAAGKLRTREIRPGMAWTPTDEQSERLNHSTKAKDLSPNKDADPEHPLYGRAVAFTGELSSMTRLEAWNQVARVGGLPAQNVTKATDVLVIGGMDPKDLQPDSDLTGKERRAFALLSKGHPIELWSEEDFIRVL